MTAIVHRSPVAEPLFAPALIAADRRADGSIWLRSTTALQPGARCTGEWLEHWAQQTPHRVYLAERWHSEAPWTTLSYDQALRQVRAAASFLLANRLSADRPLVVLSDNSIDHAILSLAAMHVGVPVAAISPAYSLMSKDFEKLKGMIRLLDPGALYVASLPPFEAALAAIAPLHRAILISTELKLVPSGDKLEVRVRGPNVTPGYWKAPELTAEAFDAEGFYRIGDAVTFADPARPELGLFFDGRVAEDFKLNSGTWVSVGTLRIAGIAALAPLAQDIVVTGHGGDQVGFLVFPNFAACRSLAGLPDQADAGEVIGNRRIRALIAQGLAKLKAQSGGASSGHATRALLLAEPASVDGGEITDKGYINQLAVLTRRNSAVAILADDESIEWIGCAG